MAYRSLEREASYAYGSSSSCLDGVPFKIGPQFQVPNKVKIQADFLKSPKHAREEYNFEIEEGVMKWALEREKALERERQLQAQKLQEHVKTGPINITQVESDSEPEDDWLKQNRQSSNVPPDISEAPTIVRERPKPPPRPPQPRGAVISNDILTPTPIASAYNDHKNESGSNKPVDVTLFETEDDPFDMFERQTLNDLEELKTVFQCTNQTTSVTNTQPIDNVTNTQVNTKNKDINIDGENIGSNTHLPGGTVNNAFSDSPEPQTDAGDYVTLKDNPIHSSSQIDVNKLPPVPPRRFLTGKDPLPPINFQSEASAIFNQPTQTVNSSSETSNPFLTDTFSNAQPSMCANTNSPYFKPLENINYENIDIQNGRVVFSRKSESSSSHESLLKPALNKGKNSNYVNVAPALPPSDNVIRSAKSTPDISNTVNGVATSTDVFDNAPFPLPRSPPYRPSSQQSWNKYSPLPSPTGVSKSSSTSDFASPSEVDPYLKLSSEGQEVVTNLVGMGFSRPRVARAVENFGCDEKEIIDHLFQVDKMAEAGFDPYQSELALVLHKNKKEKAEVYLTIYRQFQELGFSGDRIKEALVKCDNNRDQALDYLTT